MAQTVSEANALNHLLRYIAGEPGYGAAITHEQAVQSAAILLKGSYKTLGAGYTPTDAPRLVPER